MREIAGGKKGNAGKIRLLEKGETANPNGRPRKLINHIIEEMKASGLKPVRPIDIMEALEYMLNLNEEDIVAMVNNKDVPFFMRLIAAALTQKGRGFDIVERILDRVHGRPRNYTDITSGGNPFLEMLKQSSGGKPAESTENKD